MTAVRKSTATILVICTVCLAVVMGIFVAPNLFSVETIMSVGNVYPEYTFDELVVASDRIENCVLVDVEPSKMVERDSGGYSIVTDYIFKSIEIADEYFVLRLNGGTVGDMTSYNSDGTDLAMCIGSEYVLFLNELTRLDESSAYDVSNESIQIEKCYSLMTGAASIFVLDNSIQKETIIS